MGLAGKNILVTGGTGFIGSHLVESLVSQKAKIILTYQSTLLNTYFYKQKLDLNTILIQSNLRSCDQLLHILTKYEIEYIFHLAAQPIVNVAYENPLETLQTNILGTVNILESARRFGKIKCVLITSSDKAYGKNPRVAETSPLVGDHPYETSKSAADLIALTYYKTYKLPIIITRFGNVYGEGDLNFSRIMPGIMRSIITGEVLNIRSNGKHVRDYVNVNDVVDAMNLLVQKSRLSTGETFNVSSKENLSVIELIQKIEKVLGLKIHYKIENVAINEIPHQSVNYNKISKMFNWKPKRSIENTASNIRDWYQSFLNQEN